MSVDYETLAHASHLNAEEIEQGMLSGDHVELFSAHYFSSYDDHEVLENQAVNRIAWILASCGINDSNLDEALTHNPRVGFSASGIVNPELPLIEVGRQFVRYLWLGLDVEGVESDEIDAFVEFEHDGYQIEIRGGSDFWSEVEWRLPDGSTATTPNIDPNIVDEVTGDDHDPVDSWIEWNKHLVVTLERVTAE